MRMSIKALNGLLFTGLLSTILISCGGSTRKQSSGTGWKINDPKGGFQFNSAFKDQAGVPWISIC